MEGSRREVREGRKLRLQMSQTKNIALEKKSENSSGQGSHSFPGSTSGDQKASSYDGVWVDREGTDG